MNDNKKDILDEAIKLLFLENAAALSDEDTLSELSRIESTEIIEMSENARERLLSRLMEVVRIRTLGQILDAKLAELNMNSAQVSAESKLPLSIVEDLIGDAIYTNNVPILLFKKLLNMLKISFSEADQSIRKTFEILQYKNSDLPTAYTSSPVYRKSLFTSKEPSALHTKSDGKELYENIDALDKYLVRLNEIL